MASPLSPPDLTSPAPGSEVGRQRATVFAHTWSSSNPSVSWADIEAQWRVSGSGGAFTAIALTGKTLDAFTVPASTFSLNTIELQVRNKDTAGMYTAWRSFTYVAKDVPTAPTLTAPATGATITATPANVTWTVTSQTAYQVQVLDSTGATVIYDSGAVGSTSLRAHSVPLNVNATRQFRVRVQNGSTIWSDWATNTGIIVNIVPPAVPTITSASAVDFYGIGSRHQIRVSVTHPTPAGGQPTVTRIEMLVRRQGDTSAGVLLVSPAVTKTLTSAVWDTPAEGSWQVKVQAYSADGRFSETAWTNVTNTVTINGVTLLDPSTPAGVKAFRLNGEGARDRRIAESAVLSYDGRTYPVVEYGDNETREVEVASLVLRTDADRDALVAFALLRGAVLYRDARGRKAYVVLEVDALEDTFYGYATALKMQVIDYPSDVS